MGKWFVSQSMDGRSRYNDGENQDMEEIGAESWHRELGGMKGEHETKLLSLIGQAAHEGWERITLTPMRLGFKLGPDGVSIVVAHLHTLGALRRLDLTRSGIGPDGMRALLAAGSYLGCITDLYLDSCELGDWGLGELATGLALLSNLECMYLGDNEATDAGIEALCEGLRNAHSLRRLSLSTNRFGDRGVDGIAIIAPHLARLEALDLAFNYVTTLGAERLASVVKHWPELDSLNFAGDAIGDAGAAALAATAADMKRLRLLGLAENRVGSPGAEALARAAARWPHLFWLGLARNAIGDPGAAALLEAACEDPWRSSLERLELAGNPVDFIPEEILRTENASVWRAYGQDLARGVSRLYECKVVLLGEGRVGKTHLRHRLFGYEPTYFNARELQTHDVETAQSIAPVAIDGEAMNVSMGVWDFGGQGHLHASHRLFLSDRRGLFIIVCDATRTRAENRLDYWLRLVRYEASAKSPIIVAVTKCDLVDDSGESRVGRRLESLDEAELRRSAGMPSETPLVVVDDIGWCGTAQRSRESGSRSARHLDAIKNLQDTLWDLVPSVPDLNVRYPASLVRLIRWLRTSGFNGSDGDRSGWVAGERFRDACRRFSVPDDLSEVALGIAHSLGIVHHAGARRQLRRGETLAEIIFNPEWVRTPAYRVIRETNGGDARGVLSWEQVEAIVPEHKANPQGATLWEQLPFTAADRVRVIDLMRDCGLVFELPRGSHTPRYFVPDHLLPRGACGAPPGDYAWKREFEWLPESAFGQLLGRLWQQVLDDPVALWRDEITVSAGKHSRMTVRFIAADRQTDSRGRERTVSTVFAAFTGCTESEAVRLLGLVDANLRAILEEDAVGPPEWEPVGRKAKARSGEREPTIPEYAQYAARVYDAVKEAKDRDACTIRSWTEMLVWAAELVRLRDEQGEPDIALAAAVNEARADVERFARYCNTARRRAWWSNRGKRKSFGSSRDFAGERGGRQHDGGDGDSR